MPRCEGHPVDGRPESVCPHKRNDNSVRHTQGDLMRCPDCDEFRFPLATNSATPTSASCHSLTDVTAASTNMTMVKCEVLYFIQNKCSVLPVDSIVFVCANFYTCAELDDAKGLLGDLLSNSKRLPRHNGSDDVKRRKIATDLVKTCLDPNLHLPTICSTNIQRIPSVGLEHVHVSSLLQEVAALCAEVRSLVSIRAEVCDIRKTVAEIHTSTAVASDVTPVSDGLSTAPTTAAQVLSAAVQSGAFHNSEVKDQRRPPTVVGKASNKKIKTVVTKRKVNVFVSRLSPDTSDSEVQSCAADTFAEVCGSQLSDDCLHCEKLTTRYHSYASFWISFAVDPDLYDTATTHLMSAETWPCGVLVRRYYPPKHNG